MTLLIGTISERYIVLTADGLSSVNPTTGAGIGSDAFQKIFPIPDIPIVLAHHGLNILSGMPIWDFIENYVRQSGAWLGTATIKEIADDVRSYTAKAAEFVLSHPSNKGVIGFWIAGYSPREGRFELYEVCWPDNSTPVRHELMVLGGDGKQFIELYLDKSLDQFHPNSLWHSPIDRTLRYHHALYKKAEEMQDASRQHIFGGQQHQLVLEKSRWRWTKRPVAQSRGDQPS